MARTKISEFSATPSDNTDIDGIDIAEGCAPSGINNAIRELMAQLKDMQTGASGDTFTLTTVNSTTVDTTNLEATNLKAKDGTAAGSIANSTGVVTLGSSVLTTTDINGGTVDGTTIGATTPSTVVATQVDITAQGDLRLQDTTGGQYVALQAPGTIATSYTLTLPVDDGTSGQALITDGSGVLSWSTAASGDVYGPASATDNAVARYDGTTGKIIQNSAVTIADDGATVIAANSTSDGLRITQIGTGNALLVEDSANPDATPFVVNNSGFVLIGKTTTQDIKGAVPSVQLHSTIANPLYDAYANFNWSATNQAAGLAFAKSRSGTIGTYGSVASGDNIGQIIFSGDDGTAFSQAATITVAVDGTPGTDDMPGRLVFSTTADGASSPTERMRINNAGEVGIGAASSTAVNLFVGKNITGGTAAYGVLSQSTIQSDVTSRAYLFRSRPSTAASSFTLSNLYHYGALQNTIGLGSTVTNQYGFTAESSLTGATNNYGFYGDIASGTGRYNFYAAGTAANVFVGTTSIGGAVGAESLRVTPVASAVNYFNAQGSATGNTPALSVQGSDANIQFAASSKGTAALNFFTNAFGQQQFAIAHTASAVNYLQVVGNVTGSGPVLSSQGSDTNINIGYVTKGTGLHAFATNITAVQFQIAHTASAVNYLQVTGAATGVAPVVTAAGSDTNIDLALTPKGTGNVRFGTLTATSDVAITGYIEIKDSAGNVRKLAVIT